MSLASLYLDHQSLAPLIHALEDVVDFASRQLNFEHSKSQIRKPIYREFVAIVQQLYAERGPLLDEGAVKLENIEMRMVLGEQIEGRVGVEDGTGEEGMDGRGIRTRSRKRLEVELSLMEWMIGSDRSVFEKREVVEKYSELWGARRQLSTGRLLRILEKYRLWNVVIRGRNGEEHFLREDVNGSSATVVKREEFSKEMSRILGWAGDQQEWGVIGPIAEREDEVSEEPKGQAKAQP